MKRLVIILLLLCAVEPALSQAKWGGIARQIAMGGANAGSGLILNPFVWEDPAYLLLNPAYQTMYKDYVWMNINGGLITGLTSSFNGYGHQSAGLNVALNDQVTVGAVLSYDPSAANTVGGLIAGTGGLGFNAPSVSILQRSPQTMPQIQNVWEALVSYDGNGIDLGFGFMYGNAKNESNVTQTFQTSTGSSNAEVSSRMFGFRAGGIFDLGSGNFVEGAFSFRTDKATDKFSTTTPTATTNGGEYSASGTELQVNGRVKLKMSNRLSLIPYAGFATLSGEPKEDTKPTSATAATTRSIKASATLFSVGVGPEYRTPDVYLAAGVSFTTAKGKIEYNKTAVTTPTGTIPDTSITLTSTYTAIPVFNIGGEWWFTDWLAGRAGYYRSLGSNTTKSEGRANNGASTFTSEVITTAPTSNVLWNALNEFAVDGLVTFGVGFRFGNFSLDATVSEEALRRGFGLIGAQDNINSFGYMNASYSFH
ncbi:MAG: hypothetical protein HY961_01410 [Ignavibacteriae bacterium]|nr:hypothetical protein [Ignavibacteriota bacterium]